MEHLLTPSAIQITEAGERINSYIHKTPVLTSTTINEMIGGEVYFKCENFQKIGAFKIRGALNAVLAMNKEDLKFGIVTHSSGNHAQAIALSAKMVGARAYIVMPENCPKVKIEAVRGYGAEIILCEPTLQAREREVNKIVEKTNAEFIHPYNDYRVITGQATCAKELLNEHSDVDAIFAPVGGGGLLSGTSLSAHYFFNNTNVFGAEPEGAKDAFLSFKSGKIVPAPFIKTIADGLMATLGDKTFPIIQQYVKDIYTVSDEEIIAAMKILWERMKIVIEPSGAVSFAALIKNKDHFKGKKAGVILTGGNVDLGKMKEWF